MAIGPWMAHRQQGADLAGLAELMRQTRHRSTEVTLGYLRPADLWRNNVTERVFAAMAAAGRGVEEKNADPA